MSELTQSGAPSGTSLMKMTMNTTTIAAGPARPRRRG